MKLYGITSKFKVGSLVGEVRTHTTLFTSPESAITHIARIFASEKWGNVLVKWEGNSEFHYDEYNAPNDHLHTESFPITSSGGILDYAYALSWAYLEGNMGQAVFPCILEKHHE